jgi:hypothetical protein
MNLSWREADLPERLRTKHVHRLHPYLGKFVPQLAEVFLRKYRPSAVYDPFMGSGTTVVEANALGIAAYGCDISAFNCLVATVKTERYDLPSLDAECRDILVRADELTAAVAYDGDLRGYFAEWYLPEAARALLAYRALIPRYRHQKVLQVVLSRAARSARLATHDSLDSPRQPQREPYYCHKHRRICQPTRNAAGFLRRYSADTIARLRQFALLRSDAPVEIVHGDARQVPVQLVDLVLTSPPYVGLIDYHEQHRYAFELLDLPRCDRLEIGAAGNGTSKRARLSYRRDVGEVLAIAADSLRGGGRVVIVVGDRFGIFEGLAAELGLREELTLRRHVNRRTGRRAAEFFEDILVWRKA